MTRSSKYMPLFVIILLAQLGLTRALWALDKQAEGMSLIKHAVELTDLHQGSPYVMRSSLTVRDETLGERGGKEVITFSSIQQWRRDLHMTGYDEVAVFIGHNMYRSRSLSFTPPSLRTDIAGSLRNLPETLSYKVIRVFNRKMNEVELRCVYLQQKADQRDDCHGFGQKGLHCRRRLALLPKTVRQLRRYDANLSRNAIKKQGKSSRNNPESGQRGQFVGLLNVGNDIGRLPQGIRLDRLQRDGPVVLAVAGHADDVEFDAAAQRMAVERKHHPPPDLLKGRLGFAKIPVHIHFCAPSICRPSGRGGGPSAGAIVAADMVNGALRLAMARAGTLNERRSGTARHG